MLPIYIFLYRYDKTKTVMALQKAAVLEPVILKAAWKTHIAFNYKYFCGTMLTLKANAH